MYILTIHASIIDRYCISHRAVVKRSNRSKLDKSLKIACNVVYGMYIHIGLGTHENHPGIGPLF